jgi:hypothetical protein
MRSLSFEFSSSSRVYKARRKFQPLRLNYFGKYASKHRHRHIQSGTNPKTAKNTTHRNYKNIVQILLRTVDNSNSGVSQGTQERASHSSTKSSKNSDPEDSDQSSLSF